jgi:hypothetical protein
VEDSIIGLLVIGAVIVFFSWFWFSTYYEIGEEYLKIVSGPIRSKLEKSSKNSIKRTRNPLSSPALSLNRLEIKYGKWGFALISLKMKRGFAKF